MNLTRRPSEITIPTYETGRSNSEGTPSNSFNIAQMMLAAVCFVASILVGTTPSVAQEALPAQGDSSCFDGTLMSYVELNTAYRLDPEETTPGFWVETGQSCPSDAQPEDGTFRCIGSSIERWNLETSSWVVQRDDVYLGCVTFVGPGTASDVDRPAGEPFCRRASNGAIGGLGSPLYWSPIPLTIEGEQRSGYWVIPNVTQFCVASDDLPVGDLLCNGRFVNGSGIVQIVDGPGTARGIGPPGTTPDQAPKCSMTNFAELDFADSFDEVSQVSWLHGGHSIVLRLYWAVLNREPELGGAQFWIRTYNSGDWDIRRIAAHFVVSQEFQDVYGDKTNAEFVSLIYNNMLDRDAETGGFNFWKGQLDDGMSRAEMVLLVSNDTEFINRRPLPSDVRPDTGPLG